MNSPYKRNAELTQWSLYSSVVNPDPYHFGNLDTHPDPYLHQIKIRIRICIRIKYKSETIMNDDIYGLLIFSQVLSDLSFPEKIQLFVQKLFSFSFLLFFFLQIFVAQLYFTVCPAIIPVVMRQEW